VHRVLALAYTIALKRDSGELWLSGKSTGITEKLLYGVEVS